MLPFVTVAALDVILSGGLHAADAPAPMPPPRTTLPQVHEYQKQLRAFMATLSEKDFVHGVSGGLSKVSSSPDPEYQYRQHLFTMMAQPMIGTKRGPPSVHAPAALFPLSAIETPEGVKRPPVWPESLSAFERWDYPGNPYHNNRALKLRAFVTASVILMMLDDYLDQNPLARRSDYLGYKLVYTGASYRDFKDALPPDVQQAYTVGLKKLAQRILEAGPKGEEPNLDMTAPVGLWYASQAIDDPDFTNQVEDYARKLFTDPRYFHPAGYYVERGGLDEGFSGMTNFFAVWIALASDWPFAKDAVDRVYRLRAHLCLPEPEGKFTGPSHFNTRLGSPACADQWDWYFRDYAAAMLTDEAAYLTKLPSHETLESAAFRRSVQFNFQLKETVGHRRGMTSYDHVKSRPWSYHLWDTYNFPASVNFGYEFYRPGAYAHRLKLEQENSPLLKSPFLRAERFIRNFADAFVVAKQPTYSVILHTGPVGTQDPADGFAQFSGPLGLGGGQLSAFWTPKTSSVILGRRSGMGWDGSADKVEQWRLWPIHAVSGQTVAGKFFTSARIPQPEVSVEVKGNKAQVKVGGTIPASVISQEKHLAGKLDYTRKFQLDGKGVRIETSVGGDGQDQIAELYETLPVFLRDAGLRLKAAPTTIEFLVSGQWEPATADYRDQVTAVKLARLDGAVQISFEHPQRVKLSSEDWKDTYLSHAFCRNIMVDLLQNGDKPAVLKEAKTVSYRIEPQH